MEEQSERERGNSRGIPPCLSADRSKGSKIYNVYIKGRFKSVRLDSETEKWEDGDGNKKQVTKVIESKLIMLAPHFRFTHKT
jgi:hypothetical protein